MTTQTLLDALAASIEAAGRTNRDDQLPPAAILWPDEARQWEALLPELRARLPLLTLGAYDPKLRRGPAYWIRCAIAGALPEVALSAGPPVVYLPGYGKGDLRAIESCPRPLQPLAELQYRGALWVHRNGRDWKVSAFLHDLDVPVAADAATREALGRALPLLAREPVERLRRAAPLRAEFFNELLHPDPVRQMLLWLDAPEAYRARLSAAEWAAFCALAAQKFGVDPARDGPLTAAAQLGDPRGEWSAVWGRYAEAPTAYLNLPDLLERARPPIQLKLFDGGRVPYWPQDNAEAESELRDALNRLDKATAEEARAALAALENVHGSRRGWVWAGLGRAPLAMALEHLDALSQLTRQPLAGASVAAMTEAYASWGWEADAAALRALGAVEEAADVAAIRAALLPLYRPWLEAAARRFQELALAGPDAYVAGSPAPTEQGACLLFSDALRYDVAQTLVGALRDRGMTCDLSWQLAALPPVTPTAKPALSPAADALTGGDGTGLSPADRTSSTTAGTELLRRLIREAGYQDLRGGDTGDPNGRGWTEYGAIDRYGHEHGWKLAHHAPAEARALAERVAELLDAGWTEVRVITDHGWLLLPGGLPKADLPIHQTAVRKGRCAVLRPGVQTDEQTVPWHWNRDVRIAVARDIRCYEAGKEYEHGGLSPQECVVPVLVARRAVSDSTAATLREVHWSRLRVHVQLTGAIAGATIDVRARPGDPTTSLTGGPKAAGDDGYVSLLVADEDLEGRDAWLVVLRDDAILVQQQTTIGED